MGSACRAAGTAAIVRGAEMRAALQDFSGNADVGLTWIKAGGLGPAARVLRNTTGFRGVGLVLDRPPIGSPFPDIADYVLDAVAVGQKRRHRRGRLVTVLVEILDREIALPGVRHVPAVWRQRAAPGELPAVESAACRKFPP